MLLERVVPCRVSANTNVYCQYGGQLSCRGTVFIEWLYLCLLYCLHSMDIIHTWTNEWDTMSVRHVTWWKSSVATRWQWSSYTSSIYESDQYMHRVGTTIIPVVTPWSTTNDVSVTTTEILFPVIIAVQNTIPVIRWYGTIAIRIGDATWSIIGMLSVDGTVI